MKEFQVYAIVSLVDHRIYVGIAVDPIKRVIEHNAGKTSSTKAFIPWQLFYTEHCGNASQARAREIYFKTAAGKRRLKAILNKKIKSPVPCLTGCASRAGRDSWWHHCPGSKGRGFYMKEFHFYAIVSLVDQRIYVGIAVDPIKRVIEHNAGKTSSTKAFIPWQLFYTEHCGNASQARAREIQLHNSTPIYML